MPDVAVPAVTAADAPPVAPLRPTPRHATATVAPSPAWHGWAAAALVVALALLSSWSGLRNGFAYDDRWIISETPQVHSLARWWHLFAVGYWPPQYGSALYRPIPLVLYAVEWAAGGGKPFVFHAVNVALYAVLCVLVLRLFVRIVPTRAAVAAAALYAVHPVHVEAVANCVGQAELLAGVVGLSAVLRYLSWRRRGPLTGPQTAALCAMYAVACCCKESAIVLPVVLAAVEATLLRGWRPWREHLRVARPPLLLMLLVAAAFLYVRNLVLGGFAGDEANAALQFLGPLERARVMLGLVPTIGRLMVWPARLLADYSPADVATTNASLARLAWGAALLGGAFAAAAWSWARGKALVAFAVAWFAIWFALLSNVLIPTGVLIAERTMLMPSVGAMLLVGLGLAWLDRRASGAPRQARVAVRTAAVLAVTALCTLGAWRSAARQPVWMDNRSVFTTLLRDAPTNYKSHYAFGGMLFDEGHFDEGVREWHTAIALMPGDLDLYVELGHRLVEVHRCAEAAPLLDHVLRRVPTAAIARLYLIACDLRFARFRDAQKQADVGLRLGGSPLAFTRMRLLADSALIRADSVHGGTP